MDLQKLPGLLLPWYNENKRDLPWRQDREPYHIWLSEIMLQQTRVEAVKRYYERFLSALPDIAALSRCPDDELFKLWEGLGYYSRARNLKAAAGIIQTKHGGRFPEEHTAIRALPGIGDYTAGAIASICFEVPTPAVDGNVLRVLSRFLADEADVSRPAHRKAAAAALAAVYPKGHCGEFTQALMELGATVCLPKGQPGCAHCPLGELCRSRAEEGWRHLPRKAEKAPRKQEEHTVFILSAEGRVAIRKRPEKGLLAGLWEFPNCPGTLDEQAALDQVAAWGCQAEELLSCRRKTHVFTHIHWTLCGYDIRCRQAEGPFLWVSKEELAEHYSLPSAFRQFWEK